MIPWGEALLAAARLGVAPEAFWRLSLKEWRLMADANGAAGAMAASELALLAAKYPDGGKHGG